MKILKKEVEKYLQSIYGSSLTIKKIGNFPLEEDEIKGFGYGEPLVIEFEVEGEERKVVLSTMRGDSFGHDFRSDRAQVLLLAHETFNNLSRHVKCVDVGAVTKEGKLISLGESEEFFIITPFVEGKGYFLDLERLKDSGLTTLDRERALALSDYLVEIHSRKKDSPELYKRRLRDLVGHGEGIMGLIDNYPSDWDFLPSIYFENLEKKCVEWRHRLKEKHHRLSQVHGDFHPWNILFYRDRDFWVLDRSRGEWGEPADDLTALSINYLFFSWQAYKRVRDPFYTLFLLFWENYLEKTGDVEILEAAPPFYAWRGLVIGSPIWYPNLEADTRRLIFNFIQNVLEGERFKPEEVASYIE